LRQLTDLRQLCLQSDEEVFARYGGALPCRTGSLSYTDNGSNILGVCHVDTVHLPRHYHQSREKAFSGALDDRLGIYILTCLLPKKGILLDWLLTDNEEHGASTARYFETTKQYNWLIEFDRAGDDVVMYQYDDARYDDILHPYGLTIGRGSYSDICELEALGVAGFNFGIGYHLQHSPACYVDLQEMLRQVDRFAAFYHDHAQTRFEYDASFAEWPGLWEGDEYAYDDPEYGTITLSEVWSLEEKLYYGTEPKRLTSKERSIFENFLQW
jgi:hypothetical protein